MFAHYLLDLIMDTFHTIDNINFLTAFVFSDRFGPYFVSPIVAGLDKVGDNEWEPVVCTYDSIGCPDKGGHFQVAGTGSELLYGVAETFFKPDMNPEELYETVSNCLLSALDRDSLSGWGAYIYILTPDDMIVRALKTRQD